jgi:DNA mismatch endonuclease (patch repair protein)
VSAPAYDAFTPAERSAVMRAVKSKDTAPERAVRAAARELGFSRRYRLNRADIVGKPDLVFSSLRKVVFVHGCFWHRHDCKRGARRPKHNAIYWADKIGRNSRRDAATAKTLKRQGWAALTIWECETRDAAALKRKLGRFLR